MGEDVGENEIDEWALPEAYEDIKKQAIEQMIQEKREAALHKALTQKVSLIPPDSGVGISQSAGSAPPKFYGTSSFDSVKPALPPATRRFIAFIESAFTPIEWLYSEVLMLPERFVNRVAGEQLKHVPPNCLRGCFYGEPNVIVLQMFRPNDKLPRPVAVRQIPDDIVKEMIAEEVNKKLVE
jgi:hypothetical protein